jgi:opacity protein-like surface antigen
VAASAIRGSVLPYVTGRLAWARHEFDYDQEFLPNLVTNFNQSKTHFGWTIGAGVEVLLTERVSAKIEYAYADFGDERYSGEFFGATVSADIDLKMQTVKVGLNYRF